MNWVRRKIGAMRRRFFTRSDEPDLHAGAIAWDQEAITPRAGRRVDLVGIVDWYNAPRNVKATGDAVIEQYIRLHPRTQFLKTLPPNAVVADIGAGDGTLSTLRGWPEPARRDLRMYAYSLEKGIHFDSYDGFEISDWNVAPPVFDGLAFDAVVSGHFIEHIDDPTSFIDWLGRKLVPGGRVYVEWPSKQSRELPPLTELLDAGIDIVISRYEDDCTHKEALPEMDELVACAERAGFDVVASGIIRMPEVVEDQLLANFRDAADRFPVQAAFWSWTEWAQYLVLVRAGAHDGHG